MAAHAAQRAAQWGATVPSILVSSGEPAGIGPDISIALAAADIPARIAVLGDPAVLEERARRLGHDIELMPIEGTAAPPPHRRGRLCVLPVPATVTVQAGRTDPRNADYVLAMIREGAARCLRGSADALVTAPVHKSVITDSGIPFSGHTEFLAALTDAPQPVMLLVSDRLRVALATTHLPLRSVPDAIDPVRLDRVLQVLATDLSTRFGLAAPRIAVLGLNPHAGEDGTLGDEEIRLIAPAIRQARERGLDVSGPLPADTAFTREALSRCDAVLAMYHDQGLPVIKAFGFGDVVNVTCGLPIVRTSVDHGTALSLAGTGHARADSLLAAVRLAITLASANRA